MFHFRALNCVLKVISEISYHLLSTKDLNFLISSQLQPTQLNWGEITEEKNLLSQEENTMLLWPIYVSLPQSLVISPMIIE